MSCHSIDEIDWKTSINLIVRNELVNDYVMKMPDDMSAPIILDINAFQVWY
jgi:hypothetical protein